MVRIALAVLATTLALSTAVQDSALGQNAAAPGKPDEKAPPTQRYRFSHSAEGVLRLDNETGQVTLCRPLNGGWVCNPAPEETAVLKVELERKDGEVKKLTAAFDALKAELASAQDAASDKRKTLEDEVAQLQGAIGGLKDEIAGLKTQIAEAGKQGITQEERHGLVSRLALLEQDNSGLKGALARLENESADLKKKLEAGPRSDLEPAVTQAIAANEALRRDLTAATDKIAALEKQLGDNSGRHATDAAIAKVSDANESLKRELAAAKEQLADLQKQVAAQNDRAAQQAAIAKLKDDNNTLTDRVAALEADNTRLQDEIAAMKPPPPPPVPQAQVPPDKKDELKLPSRQEMERARAALTDAWQRLMEMIGQLQKDMLGNRDEPPVRL
jgi:predicted  nucleic acid-binding Zn-ribbon protein